jgi:hypothetical protein
MKYIKEYDDSDLEGLIGDLSDIGHQHKFIEGKDFGFGPDLKGENDGKSILFVTPFTKSILGDLGILDRIDNFNWRDWEEFKTPERNKFKMPYPDIFKSEYLISLDYPQRFNLNRPGNLIPNLWFIGLSYNPSGVVKEFPLMGTYVPADGTILDPEKIKSGYEIFLNKIKSLKF